MSDFTTVLDEVLETLVTDQCAVDSGEYNGDVTSAFDNDNAKQAIIAAVQSLVEEVIGEDTPTPRPEPDYLLGDVYGVEANELRAEQRKALTAKLGQTL